MMGKDIRLGLSLLYSLESRVYLPKSYLVPGSSTTISSTNLLFYLSLYFKCNKTRGYLS